MNNRGKFIIRNIISAFVAILVVTFIFFTIINIAFNIIYMKTDVRGFSMQPTLNENILSKEIDGDVVYINKFAKPELNDVVVADVKWNDDSIIKRLVGMPGDKIRLTIVDSSYMLYNNENLMYSRPIDFDTSGYMNFAIQYPNKYSNSYFDVDGSLVIELQEDEYFLMGDHWTASMLDCIKAGPVHESNLIGRVDMLIKYTEENKIEKLTESILNILVGKRVKL